jgi:SEC-C motif-containing protein
VANPGLCPCGSRDAYIACCGPLHTGERPAVTALALMRSRFSAFALGRADYLRQTWHHSTRPDELDLDAEVTWRRLQIVDTVNGTADDADGIVEFRAQYERAGSRHILHERSRFRRSDGQWRYLDGQLS